MIRRIAWVLLLAGCDKGCIVNCPEGSSYQTTGWLTGPGVSAVAAIPPEGATLEVGDDALNETYHCFSVDRFVPVSGRLDPNTLADETLTIPPDVSDLTGNKVRIVLDCVGGTTPASFQVRWYGPDGRAIGNLPVALPDRPDSGVIEGLGYLCVYNPTNVEVEVTGELYLPDGKCATDSANIRADANLQGGVSGAASCSESPPPISLCPDPGELPGEHVFCEICGGSYETRITRYFFGYCEDAARAIAQSQAANCQIEDGPCD